MKALLICLSLVVLGILVFALLSATGYFVHDAQAPSTAAEATVKVPKYTEVPVDFVHQHDGDVALPTTGAAWLDVDGDGQDELFLSGGATQADALLRFDGEAFKAMAEPYVIEKAEGVASYGAASVDANGDGRTDLFVSRGDGISLHLNTVAGFETHRIDDLLNEKTVGFSLALADLDHDGWVDLYVSGYLKPEYIEGLTIFNDDTYGGSSRLLMNQGDNTFRDATVELGLDYVHNTFQAVFVDADDDGDQDLIVAHDTGHVRTYRNRQQEDSELRFEIVDNPTSSVFAYPMGIGVGDSDGNGLPDFLFPNTGTTVPDFLARGDLRPEQTLHVRWIHFQTNADLSFTDVAETTRVADYEFGWGAVFADMNLDGLQDLIVSENFIDFPAHKITKLPGRFLLQNPDGTFAPAGAAAGAENPYYGISPLVADINRDGAPDLIHLNLDGPARALLSQDPPDAHFLEIEVPDTPEFLNAKVVVTLANGTKQTDWLVGNEGLGVDQPSRVTFGLGGESRVEWVDVMTASGNRYTLEKPAIDQRVRLPLTP